MQRPPHPANCSRPLRQLEEAGEMWDRIHAALPETWSRIVDSIGGQPGAQNYDGDSGGAASVLDEYGVPMPTLSDPTGEAGCRKDRPTQDLAELRRLCRRHMADAERVTAILASYVPRDPYNFEQTGTSADGEPGCVAHHRAGVWAAVAHRWKQGGDGAVDLCSSCYRYASTRGTTPSKRAVEHFETYDKWPKQYVHEVGG